MLCFVSLSGYSRIATVNASYKGLQVSMIVVVIFHIFSQGNDAQEQQEWSTSLVKEECPHIKEELEELLLGPEVPDGSMIILRSLKHEDDEENTSSLCFAGN